MKVRIGIRGDALTPEFMENVPVQTPRKERLRIKKLFLIECMSMMMAETRKIVAKIKEKARNLCFFGTFRSLRYMICTDLCLR